MISALAQAELSKVGGQQRHTAENIARARWPDSPSVAQALVEKAAVGAATPTVSGWASQLVVGELIDDFVEAVRAVSVIDRLLGVRRVPFEARIPKEASGGFGGSWRGAGAPIPTVRNSFDTSLTLPRTSAGGIQVISEELAKLTRPAHAIALRDLLVAGLARYLDEQFLDPTIAAVSDVSPASITRDATQITSTGATAAAILDDLRSLIAAITTNLTAPAFIMRRSDAVYLATLQTAGGSMAFPQINALGGTLCGIPVVTSASVPGDAGSPPSDRYIILIDAGSVMVADEGSGGTEISVSRVATFEMADNPSNDAATGNATSQVSMFQTHSVATKVFRPINWARAIDGCVAYMRISW